MLRTDNRVLIAYGTCAEAITLAPLVMELRGTSWLRPIVAVPRVRSAVLDELHAMLRIEPEADLDLVGGGAPLEDVIALALSGRSASFERGSAYFHALGVDVVVVGGDTATAFAVALAGFHARLPVVHVAAAARANSAGSPSAGERIGSLIAQVASLHVVQTPTERANLLREGVNADHVVVTGPASIGEHPALGDPYGDGRAAMRARAAIEELLGIGRRVPDAISCRVAGPPRDRLALS